MPPKLTPERASAQWQEMLDNPCYVDSSEKWPARPARELLWGRCLPPTHSRAGRATILRLTIRQVGSSSMSASKRAWTGQRQDL